MDIIVCSDNTKKKILLDLNDKPMMNIKFMNKLDFIHNYYFDYNEEAIYYVMNNYHVKYDIAINYLNNLIYIEDKVYGNEKLDLLVSIKKELDDNNLLINNKLFNNYLKGKRIIFMDNLNKFDLKYIEELKDICEVEIKENCVGNYKPIVYSFNTIDEEIEYVAYKICELIDNGVSPSKIKLANVGSDYDSVIKRIFKLYNLRVQESISLFGMSITNYFLDNYGSNINNTMELLKRKYDANLVNIIINIVNKYNFIDDYNKVKDLIVEDIKRTKIKTNYDNQIEIVDYRDTFDDEYIFLINFNNESIPITHQDIDYINDDIKPSFMETSSELNSIEKDIVSRFIKSTKNLIITYKLNTPFNSFYPSSMIEYLGLEVKEGSIESRVSYSKDMGLIKTCIKYDNYYKYGIKDKDLNLYSHNYKIDYGSYSNKYTKITDYNDELVLSYTSMDNYYKCGFRYYLERVLKINKDTNMMNMYIGSIFHYVLEKGLYSGIDYKNLIREYIISNNISFDIKERYFLDKLTSELPYIIEEIKRQDKYINLKSRLFEEKVLVDFGDSKFMGVIDKVMYDNDIYAIVDYKTGNTDINLNMIKHGIGMQLPVYLYLAHKKFGGHIAGFYLNQILHNNIKYDPKVSYEKKYQDNLKLYGYSNKSYIGEFDNSYQSSQIIKSLKVKNDGDFYSYSKVLSDNEIEEMIELVEDKIIECIDSIKAGKFDINPKNIDGKNISCKYCPYEDICFKKDKDIVYLGGESDA